MSITITKETQREMLRQMLRIRRVEEAIADRYSEKQMRCPVHLSIGQEAIAAGACTAMDPQDYVMSTHRAHAHFLAKGGNLDAMIAEIYGKATGCTSGRGGSMHLIDLPAGMIGSTPIVGNSIPVAAGAAFGSVLKGEDRVTSVFFGEGTTEEGVFSECLNFSVLKNLPLIFLCENNLYSVYSPLSVRQPDQRDRAAVARDHGVETFIGDGNDVEAVYRAVKTAVTRAREGKGPSFLEFSTYRWREHCGPNYDNDIGYRTEEEFQKWRKQCPIDRYIAALKSASTLSDTDLANEEKKIAEEIATAFEFAHKSPYPNPKTLLQNVYAESSKK